MRKLLLIPVLAALAAFGSLSLVDAHSRPVRFDPAPGAVLTSAPAGVTGWFTSDIRRADESFIQVLDADGNEVQTGDTELSNDRRQMSTALEAGIGQGRYLVHWSTFDDADGEVFAGCHIFFVGQAAADAAVENGEALDGGADCPAITEDDHTHDDTEADPHAASIAISIPEIVNGDSVTLEITPTNFTARAPDGNTVDPNFGHYHIYLDKVPVDLLTGEHSHDDGDDHGTDSTGSTGAMDDHDTDDDHGTLPNPGGLVENPLMWAQNSYTFTNLEPGYHTVAVALTYDDHSLFDPPVLAAQTFFVEGGSDDSASVPVWALALGVVGGLVVGGVGMKLAGSRA